MTDTGSAGSAGSAGLSDAKAVPTRPAWPSGTATGRGPMAGVDVRAALRVVLDAVPELPFLVELPGRGPGADLVGRTLALLPDFPADFGPAGWVMTDRPGRDLRRARSYLGEDLDAFEELLAGWDGVAKAQLCGPWTLAARLEMRGGHKLLSDSGATRDLHQAYGEAVHAHSIDLARRVPNARAWLLQLDEPSLPDVLAGGVSTASGWGHLPPAHDPEVESGLAAAVRALPTGVEAVFECAAAAPPVRLFRTAGANAVALDATRLTEADDDPIGEAVEAGVRLVLGVVPPPDKSGAGDLLDATTAAHPVRELWHRLGQPPERLADVVPTPTRPLDQVGLDVAGAVLRRCAEVARVFRDEPEEGSDEP